MGRSAQFPAPARHAPRGRLIQLVTCSLYFSGLAGGVLFTGALLLFATRAGSVTTAFSNALTGLLAFLVVVQFLLLPVNYGILIVSQQLPRVAEFPDSEKPASGEQIWLVWETKEALMYFSRSTDDKRSLITLPRKDPKTTIVGYDNIFRLRREVRPSFLRSLVQRRSPHARAPLGLGPRLWRNERVHQPADEIRDGWDTILDGRFSKERKQPSDRCQQL
jgi:hypothetical protein